MALTTETVVSIILGVMMVVLALFAIWQTAHHARRTLSSGCWFLSQRMIADKVPAPVAVVQVDIEAQPMEGQDEE